MATVLGLTLAGCSWNWNRFEPVAADADADADADTDNDTDAGLDSGLDADRAADAGDARPDAEADNDLDADVPGPITPWRTTFDDTRLFGLAIHDDGTIFVAGDSGGQLFVASLDPLGATLHQESYLPSGATTASAGGIAVRDNRVVTVGPGRFVDVDPPRGLRVDFIASNLMRRDVEVYDGELSERLSAVALLSNEYYWAAGQSAHAAHDIDVVVQWMDDADDMACRWQLLDSGVQSNWAQSIVFSGDEETVYIGGAYRPSMGDTRGLFAVLDATVCYAEPGCAVEPELWTTAPGDDNYHNVVQAMALGGRYLYAAMYEYSASVFDKAGRLASINTTTGAFSLALSSLDTPGVSDMYTAIAVDEAAATVYVVGVVGFDDRLDNLESARGVLGAYRIPALSLLWERELPDHRLFTGVALHPAGGIVAISTSSLAGTGSVGTVIRCRVDGDCDPG